MRPSLACGKQEDAHVSKLIAEMEERNAAEGEYSEQDVKGFKGAVPKERRMARHCTDPDGRPHCVGHGVRRPHCVGHGVLPACHVLSPPSPSMPTGRPTGLGHSAPKGVGLHCRWILSSSSSRP